MNEIQNSEELLFIKQNGCSFWVWQTGGTPKTETMAKLIPNFSVYKIKILPNYP